MTTLPHTVRHEVHLDTGLTVLIQHGYLHTVAGAAQVAALDLMHGETLLGEGLIPAYALRDFAAALRAGQDAHAQDSDDALRPLHVTVTGEELRVGTREDAHISRLWPQERKEVAAALWPPPVLAYDPRVTPNTGRVPDFNTEQSPIAAACLSIQWARRQEDDWDRFRREESADDTGDIVPF